MFRAVQDFLVLRQRGLSFAQWLTRAEVARIARMRSTGEDDADPVAALEAVSRGQNSSPLCACGRRPVRAEIGAQPPVTVAHVL